jgi:hypothetical protein
MDITRHPNVVPSNADFAEPSILADWKSDGATLVVITDATDRRRLRGELRRAGVELEAANDVLAATQAELLDARKAVAELGAANQELQKTNKQLRRATETVSRDRDLSRGLAKATLRPTPESECGLDRSDDSSAVGHVEEVR